MELTKIIKLIQSNPFYGVSENVEIAKGRDQYVLSFKQVLRKLKRWLKK